MTNAQWIKGGASQVKWSCSHVIQKGANQKLVLSLGISHGNRTDNVSGGLVQASEHSLYIRSELHVKQIPSASLESFNFMGGEGSGKARAVGANWSAMPRARKRSLGAYVACDRSSHKMSLPC